MLRATAFLSIATLVLQSASAQEAGASKSNQLITDGLIYDRQLSAMQAKNFAATGWHREDMPFTAFLPRYVVAYGERCDAFLPDNKVEIEVRECAVESYSADVYGNPVGGSTCVEYRWVGTGVYAKPELAKLKRDLDVQREGAATANLFGAFLGLGGDPLAATNSIVSQIQFSKSDAESLVRQNECGSSSLTTLEQNMISFANGEPGFSDPESVPENAATPPDPPQGYNETSYLADLIDNSIAQNAKTWMINVYRPGSVWEVNVLKRDQDGNPSSVRAKYLYFQGNSKGVGWVILDFLHGRPDCLYFHDAQSACRPTYQNSAQFFQNDSVATPLNSVAIEPANAELAEPILGRIIAADSGNSVALRGDSSLCDGQLILGVLGNDGSLDALTEVSLSNMISATRVAAQFECENQPSSIRVFAGHTLLAEASSAHENWLISMQAREFGELKSGPDSANVIEKTVVDYSADSGLDFQNKGLVIRSILNLSRGCRVRGDQGNLDGCVSICEDRIKRINEPGAQNQSNSESFLKQAWNDCAVEFYKNEPG